MRALGLAIVLTACGGKARAPAHPHESDSIREDEAEDDRRDRPHRHDDDDDDDETETHRHRRAEPDEDDDEPAMPARAIVMIAATDDGRCAVSTDALGHVRLWRPVDGKPIALELPHPKAFAMAPSQRGFEIVEIDDAGDLVIADVDAEGKTLAHASLTNDPEFVGVHMAARGAVAWRADHTIVVVKPNGKIAASIAAPPGHRVIDVATAGTHAVVLLQTRDTQRLRHLALGAKPAWGAWIDDDGSALAATTIALAPNGKRLAMILDGDAGRRVEVIDTGTGKVTVDEHVVARAIAFSDANHLAIVAAWKLTWVDLAAAHLAMQNVPLKTRNKLSPIAVGGGRLILANRQNLSIATPPR
jgi:hypothetical protein